MPTKSADQSSIIKSEIAGHTKEPRDKFVVATKRYGFRPSPKRLNCFTSTWLECNKPLLLLMPCDSSKRLWQCNVMTKRRNSTYWSGFRLNQFTIPISSYYTDDNFSQSNQSGFRSNSWNKNIRDGRLDLLEYWGRIASQAHNRKSYRKSYAWRENRLIFGFIRRDNEADLSGSLQCWCIASF